jgi:hypothetical protein
MSRRRSQLGKPALILATVLAVAATIFGAYRTTHAAGGAFVRVNQMGYATGQSARGWPLPPRPIQSEVRAVLNVIRGSRAANGVRMGRQRARACRCKVA